ncbi:MAG: hypothetical protein WA982_15585 [Rubrobacteraceae bacterium]
MGEQKKTGLTPEEQELKERLMRSGPPPVRKGTGKVSEEFWKLPKPKIKDGSLLEALLKDREEGR